MEKPNKMYLFVIIAAIGAILAGTAISHSSFAATSMKNSVNGNENSDNSTQDVSVNDNNTDGQNNAVNDKNQTSEENEGDPINATLVSQAKVPLGEANNIALGNMSAGPLDSKSIKLDDENGHLVYSVNILKGSQFFDVKVDAINGTITSIDNATEAIGNNEQVVNGSNTETNDSGISSQADGENVSQ